MAILKKANRVINVEDQFVDGYLKRGYDQIDNDGNIIKHATGGRKVNLAQYNKVVAELNALKAQKSAGNSEEVEALKADIKTLEEENERLEKLLRKYQNQQNRK